MKGLESQLDLGPGFLQASLLALEISFCVFVLSLMSGSETESVKSSCVLAMLWGMGWALPSSLSASYACASEPALVSVRKSF